MSDRLGFRAESTNPNPALSYYSFASWQYKAADERSFDCVGRQTRMSEYGNVELSAK